MDFVGTGAWIRALERGDVIWARGVEVVDADDGLHFQERQPFTSLRRRGSLSFRYGRRSHSHEPDGLLLQVS